MIEPKDSPRGEEASQSFSPLLLSMLVSILLAGVKLLLAYYTGVLLLAADGLYTLVVWYRRIFTPMIPEMNRAARIAALATGLVLASAGLGIAWNGTAEGLELLQGLYRPGLTETALIATALSLLLNYLGRTALFLGAGGGVEEDAYLERGVSLCSLLLLSLVSADYGWATGFSVLGALLFSLLACLFAVQLLYSVIESFLSDKDS